MERHLKSIIKSRLKGIVSYYTLPSEISVSHARGVCFLAPFSGRIFIKYRYNSCIIQKKSVILHRKIGYIMKRTYLFLALVVFGTTAMMAQQSDPIATGLGGVATIVGETRTVADAQESPVVQDPQDSAAAEVPVKPVPLWKQKLYYGYNFDIYFHNDTRNQMKENGWSIA